VLRALATVNPTMRRAAHVLGHRRLVDTSPARTLLGWRPRTVPEMVIAMANSLVGHGLVSAPQASG
jgi:dihydroflavonol-4-reductase